MSRHVLPRLQAPPFKDSHYAKKNIPYVTFNYCELPHLLQNFAFLGIVTPQTIRVSVFPHSACCIGFPPPVFSSCSEKKVSFFSNSGFNLGSCCNIAANCIVLAPLPTFPPAFTKPSIAVPTWYSRRRSHFTCGAFYSIELFILDFISRITLTARKFIADVAIK